MLPNPSTNIYKMEENSCNLQSVQHDMDEGAGQSAAQRDIGHKPNLSFYHIDLDEDRWQLIAAINHKDWQCLVY